ncbi:MAG: hypothetical protein CMF60_07825 [Magnetococcales bacterium]|nr:hypothetical protein [Magnetococcales bacterium]|tara:strand:- start:1243 stop:2175 length:933 start_codon:yes stop_codon:yes gene_type:complete
MSWVKKGLIYTAGGEFDWNKFGFMTPCPVLMSDDVIRIYGGVRDNEGVSRIAYVDVDANNPNKVINKSAQPVLDIGEDGMFDENGVILGDVIRLSNGNIRMYYVGFQLGVKHKFSAFSGVAESSDDGETFKRLKNSPVLDRSENSLFISAIHTAIFENGVWRIWYATGNGWRYIDGKPYPEYEIRYIESVDGISFDQSKSKLCILPEDDEYRIGRPRVTKTDNGYIMRFTYDTLAKEYTAGRAFSSDGLTWEREYKPNPEIQKGFEEWDSEMACYLSYLSSGDHEYLFYNGNDMGATGVGYAIKRSKGSL